MTRVFNGFWYDVALNDGIFLEDREMDLVLEWLDSYADALEKAWKRNGSEGDVKSQKFTKVRSLKAAVIKKRAGDEAQSERKES